MKTTLLLTVLLTLTAFRLAAAEKVALVVGNAAYTKGNGLQNPVNDAKAVGAALKVAGFSVTVVTDAGHQEMEKAITEFGREAKGAKVAWFYYAGHGMEVKGTNYLVPVDAVVEEESQVKYKTVPLGLALDTLDEAGASLKVLTLDCCRNNPLGRGFRRTTGGAGLAALTGTPKGTIIAYATAPGTTALDGTGENSPYTAALVEQLKTPGLEVEQIFKKAAKTVITITREEQQPWLSSNFVDSFVLLPGGGRPIDPLPLSRVGPGSATRERPWVNSLGMEFIPVPGMKGVLMCRTETRVQDFKAFAAATSFSASGGLYVLKVKGTEKSGYSTAWELDEAKSWSSPGFPQTGEHPVVGVSLNDAEKFTAWLSQQEKQSYRLPKDVEWSAAVGLGKYPWGNEWQVPAGKGNYCGSELTGKWPGKGWLQASEASDGHAYTSPVASYAENKFGFYDLGGNVSEWCTDNYKASMNTAEALEKYPALKKETHEDGTPYRVLRGGSWNYNTSVNCSSACRDYDHPNFRNANCGFRVVLVVAGGG